MKVPYITSNGSVTIFLRNVPRQFSLSSAQGEKIFEALKNPEHTAEEIAELADVKLYVAKVTLGRVTVCDDDQFRIDGRVVDYGLRNILLKTLLSKADPTYLTQFLEHVDMNPNKGIAEHVYRFIEKGNMPITPDGCFLAFKRVREDFSSFHSGQEDVSITDLETKENVVQRGHISHRVGTELVMIRDACDDNRFQTCSVGLHACSHSYLPHYCSSRGRVMIVKINPRDVVAVPNDYNDAKLRCCRLQVVGEIPQADAPTHFGEPVDDRYEDDNFEEEIDDIEEVVTLSEVQKWAVDDALYDIDHAGIANFDSTDGAAYFDCPDDLKSAYRIAYTIAYEDECTPDEYHSEKVLAIGFNDGMTCAEHELAPGLSETPPGHENRFEPAFEEGVSYGGMPDGHMETYVLGFLRGYLKGWRLG